MQIDPVRPVLKAPGTKRLKLKYNETSLNFAFKFDLRRFVKANMTAALASEHGAVASLVGGAAFDSFKCKPRVERRF